MLRIRVVQCLCTQCEGELLHLYEVCLPVISVEHMSQVQVWVVNRDSSRHPTIGPEAPPAT